MTRIVFLIPYFGRWPFWMPLFVESCRQNPDIDWILYSDCGPLENCPANVRIKATSFADYCTRVEQKLGIAFSPKSPYKLCDLKPAYGVLHEEDIAGYDFWAFGDIDLVYGQLRDYFTEARLGCYDFFSTHERRVSGHLCLIRNDTRWNRLFKEVPGWAAAFARPQHEAFDERAFTRLFIRHKNWPRLLRDLADRTNPRRRRAEFVEAFSTPNGAIPWIDGRKVFPSNWYWNSGVLTNDLDGARTFPYLHFIGFKGLWQAPTQSQHFNIITPDSCWRIGPDGIFKE